MTTPLRRRLRMARRGAGYTAAVLLVLVAVVLGIGNRLLPLAERHPERIAAWLGERAGRPVAFDGVRTQWTRRGPLLRLERLRIGSGGDALLVGDTEMLVSLYAGLLPGRAFSELRLRGIDLTLQRADDGRWSVRGLPGQDRPGGDPFAALERLGELQVIGGRLHVVAPSLGIEATVPRIDLRLQVAGTRVRSGLRAWIDPRAAPLDAVLDFDRKAGNGRAYAGTAKADLAAWSPLLQLAGVRAVGGSGRAQAWAELRGHRVRSVLADADLADVVLRGTALAAADGAQVQPRQRFSRVATRARWQVIEGGWRFDAPLLRVGAGEREQVLDGLLLAGGRHAALRAGRIDAGPLLQVAALSARMPPGLRRWLLAARPSVVVEQVEASGQGIGNGRTSARIAALRFSPVGNAPGVSGLAGRVEADARGLHLIPDRAAPVRVDWPAGFGVPHEVRLDGSIGAWREQAGWRVATDRLRVQGEGYAAQVRGGLWWQGDGSRPWIDLATTIDDTALATAKRFWVRHLMPKATVAWLDDALVAGRLQQVRALVSGDLDDWPFRDRDGLFSAHARIVDGTLRFQPDWPAAQQLDADVHFLADGFTVSGSGAIAGVGISRFDAGIERFGKAELTVKAQGRSDASRLLELLRQSPLRKEHGETLDNLVARGPATVDFDMWLPFHRDAGPARYGGNVELLGASLSERRWALDFDAVRGRARYARDGFTAERLAVRHDGRPGTLSLRAGAGVRDKAQVFEAELEAVLAAAELPRRAPELAWLAPYLQGRSSWTAAVSVPRAAQGRDAAPSRLRLRSDLVGTAMTLPAPLSKPAALALPASVDLPLPMGSGEVQVSLGNRMGLRAATRNGKTGVRIVLGGARVAEPPPAHGLVATGTAATLDALDWIGVAKGGGDGEGLPLRSVDVSAGRLLMLGAAFPSTRLQVVPVPGATQVTLAGTALAGTLRVPDADGATIGGRFARVHWRAASGATAGEAASATPDVDPAAIPPLAIDIDELRFGSALLGATRLRTRPTVDGLRLEQLQARSRQHAIDVDGDWRGRGNAARTRLTIGVDSRDFGQLLDGLGFGGQLAGGTGKATLDAQWPGSPARFRLDAMDGTLAVDARDGRLLEIEPGAGRVLGLLSIAQLPRRLMFDFRDFFSKGFAFNRIEGHVKLAQGSARSDDLLIAGPAADIRIRGAANLRAQTFDQTIEVLPKAGNLLTVAGALAGGPVGAAIGAAANAVLNKPLGQMAAKTYRVTGPWKDPKVEVLGREQARATANAGAAADPQGGRAGLKPGASPPITTR